ncbi:MAG: hypothetical protein VYC34_00220 [Planctomycetota bacterium]|nr:hypothetical protein [Planctomycetota bacterium]
MLDPTAQRGLFSRAFAPIGAMVVGAAAGFGMQVWLGATHLSVAAFVMSAYAAGVFLIAQRDAALDGELQQHVRRAAINRTRRRLFRLVRDPLSWWSLAFGLGCLLGASWLGGIRGVVTLGLIGLAWSLVNFLLSYELTVLHPTTRCRKCFYQLIGILNPAEPEQRVRCPECGSVWRKQDLCLTPLAPMSDVDPTERRSRGLSSAA